MHRQLDERPVHKVCRVLIVAGIPYHVTMSPDLEQQDDVIHIKNARGQELPISISTHPYEHIFTLRLDQDNVFRGYTCDPRQLGQLITLVERHGGGR